jgi:prophage antirepressor-like protein
LSRKHLTYSQFLRYSIYIEKTRGQELSMQIAIFNQTEQEQYFEDENHLVWMHGTLLCKQLGFNNPSEAITMHTDEDERQKREVKGRLVWYVSEPGVWGMILAAKTPEALEFKRRLKHEILPLIRTQGYYVNDGVSLGELMNVNSLLLCAVVSDTPKSPELQELIEQNSPHLVADDWVEQSTYREPIEESATNTWLDRAEVKFARLFAV